MNYFGFEFKKLIWTKKFFITLLLLIIAISSLFGRNLSQQDVAHEQQVDEVYSYLEFHRKKDNIYHQILLEKEDGEDEETEMLQEKNADVLQSVNVWHTNIGNEENWRTLVANEISFLEHVSEFKEMDEEHPISDSEIVYRLALNQALLDQDIPPEYEDYSIAVPNFTKQMIDLFVMYGSFFIVLLLISELLSYEFESRSISFLFTQPLKRANVIFAKFLSAFIMYLGLTFVLLMTSIGVSALFGEQGNFGYPVLIEINGVLQSIPIMEYMINAMVNNIVIILFAITLYLLISLLTQHTLLSLFLTAGTFLAGYVLTTLIDWKPFAWFNPFRYAFSTDAILYQNQQIWYQALPITFILAIVFLLITMQKIKTSRVE